MKKTSDAPHRMSFLRLFSKNGLLERHGQPGRQGEVQQQPQRRKTQECPGVEQEYNTREHPQCQRRQGAPQLAQPQQESGAEDLSDGAAPPDQNRQQPHQRHAPQGGGAIRTLGAGDSGQLCPDLRWQVLAPGPADAGELERRCRDLFAEEEPRAFLQALNALDARMNNFSLMLLLEYRGVRLLLPGDTNRAGYGAVPPELLRADLFKVGHHGQRDGVSPALLEAVRPGMAVCCASSDRRYDSAHPDTLAMIAAAGAELYFSDCPPVASGRPAPHEALEFTVGGRAGLSARYVEHV